MPSVERIEPGPGQESAWDYPRPPAIEPVTNRILVIFGGEVIADTRRAIKYTETYHPPTYYIPPDDVKSVFLLDSPKVTVCEYKGGARYYDLRTARKSEAAAAWYYPTPKKGYEPLAGHVAFYPQKMDECSVDGEAVDCQEGSFYGGWITSQVTGPFKGGVGTVGW